MISNDPAGKEEISEDEGEEGKDTDGKKSWSSSGGRIV